MKGHEKTLGRTHPETLKFVFNIALAYKSLEDYGKAEELYQRALEGFEAQLGKDHQSTKSCAMGLAICLGKAGKKQRLRKILDVYRYLLAGEHSEWFKERL